MSLPGPWGMWLPSVRYKPPLPAWQVNIGILLIIPPMILFMIIVQMTVGTDRFEKWLEKSRSG